MIEDQAGLDAYLKKMQPKIKKAKEAENAKPPRVTVQSTQEGELLCYSKKPGSGKGLNLLISGERAKFWRKNPNKIEFEGEKTKDLILKYQSVGVEAPWGLGSISIRVNTEADIYIGNKRWSWMTYSEDVSEKDVKVFMDFARRNKLVVAEDQKLCKKFIEFFDDRDMALYMSAGDGLLDKVKQCISYGFSLDVCGDSDSPLLKAVHDYTPEENQDEVIRFLLSQGANPNTFSLEDSDNGRGDTPLIVLIDKLEGKKELTLMRDLLEHGADPNQTDATGDTPLIIVAHRAEATGPDAASLLLKYGADKHMKGEAGKTAKDIAEEEENHDLLKVL